MDKLSVLVLGDGLLGSEIVKQTGWNFISRKKDGFDIFNIDESLNNVEFDIIINCIANTDTYSNDRKKHWNVNYYFVSKLIEYCNLNSKKLVHISTDYIYTGSIDNASEDDVPVHCNNWYGYTKLLSDGLVQLQSNDYLLIRCTHKPNPFPYDKAWIDQVGNFDYVDVISQLIVRLINNGASGLFNVGTELKTISELASKTKNIKNIFSPKDAPKNQSMNLEKMNDFLSNIQPFFSIAIPAFGYDGKGVEFLNYNLKKLKEQNFQDFEVVISDHSLDDTIFNVVNNWSDKLNIKYYRCEVGRGFISPNLNNCLINCTGKWIKVLFQDDFLFDEKSLLEHFKFLTQYENTKWLVTFFCHSKDDDNFYNYYKPFYTENVLFGVNTLGNPSNLTIKNEDIMLFDDSLNWLIDCEYYYRLYNKYGHPSILNKTTVVNRTHGGGLSNTTPQEVIQKEVDMVRKKYLNIV